MQKLKDIALVSLLIVISFIGEELEVILLSLIILFILLFLYLVLIFTGNKKVDAEGRRKKIIVDYIYKHELIFISIATIGIAASVLIVFEKGYFSTGENETISMDDQVSSVKQKSPAVLYDLSLKYIKEENEKEALIWVKKAAQQGSFLAQYDLGKMYEQDGKLGFDEKKSFKWYLKAAEQSHRHSQAQVALMYANGIGVKQDLVKSYMWYSISESHEKNNIRKLLSESEFQGGEYLVSKWKRKQCVSDYCSPYYPGEHLFPTTKVKPMKLNILD